MPADLETQLRSVGAALHDAERPIDPDDVIGIPSRSRHADRRRRKMATVGATLLTAASLAGALALRSTASPGPSDAATESETQNNSSASMSDGAMLLDPIPTGWRLVTAEIDQPGGQTPVHWDRFYTADTTHPETAPALKVSTFHINSGAPSVSGPPQEGGAITPTYPQVVDDPEGGRLVTLIRDDHWFMVTGYRLSDADVLLAADNARLDPIAAGAGTIDPAGLTNGMAERAVITDGEGVDPASPEGTARPRAIVQWVRGDLATGSSMWFTSELVRQESMGLPRLNASAVRDITVHGQPGYIATLRGGNEARMIVWTEGGRVNTVDGFGVAEDELLRFAESLRPATIGEWNDAVASVAPPIADLSSGEPPAPGEVVPVLTTHFPAIDPTVVPDRGLGATYASYGTPGAESFDPTTSSWSGVIGTSMSGTLDNLISVTVSDTARTEPLPTVPGRSLDIAEYDYESGAELVRTVGNHQIVMQGRDKDELYRLIGGVTPTVSQNRLTGFTFSPPNGEPLGLLAEPTGESGFEAGAIPSLVVHDGILSLYVTPTSPLDAMSGWVGPIERVTVLGRPGLLHGSFSAESRRWWWQLAVALDDDWTLTASSNGLERAEFLDAMEQVEFVDRTTWEQRFDPASPIYRP